MVEPGTSEAPRWRSLLPRRRSLQGKNVVSSNPRGPKNGAVESVKVLAETGSKSKEMGQIVLLDDSQGACQQNQQQVKGNVLLSRTRSPRLRDLTRSVFRNRSFDLHLTSTSSTVSTLTNSTVNSQDSWNQMQPSRSCSTLGEEEEEIVFQQPKGSLKITTQDESLLTVYGGDRQLDGNRQSFFMNVAGCFMDMDEGCSPSLSGHDEDAGGASGKSVKFSRVKIHYHTQTLGDQCAVKHGPPLTLGSWMASSSMSVNHFEEGREDSVGKSRSLLLNAADRREILLRSGVSRREIARCERAMQREQQDEEDSKSSGSSSSSDSSGGSKGKGRNNNNKRGGALQILSDMYF